MRRKQLFKVLLLIATVIAGTYGSVALLKLGLNSESPVMVVSSGSMIPTLNVGDIILVRGVDPNTIAAGTIVVFHSPRDYNMPIVHRVTSVIVDGEQLYFRTKGDNNPVADNWTPLPGVPSSHLIGIYTGKIPLIGLVSLRLRGPLGTSLIVLLIVLIVAIEYNDSRKKSAPSTDNRK